MRILWATDGSAGATAVGQLLALWRLTAADEICLLRAEPHAEASAAGKADAFASERAALAGSLAEVRTEVRGGPPAETILEAAREFSADLIALGALGGYAQPRFLLGRVTERVLRHADRSVLIARPPRSGLPVAIVGVDPSAAGEQMLEHVASLPLPSETELHLCVVLPPVEAVTGAAPAVWASLSGEIEGILTGTMEEAEERLRGLAQGLSARGRRVTAEIDRGDPATQLIAAVERQNAGLLFLGSQGQTPVDRFLLGSVSERLARHSPSSVCVVRTL